MAKLILIVCMAAIPRKVQQNDVAGANGLLPVQAILNILSFWK